MELSWCSSPCCPPAARRLRRRRLVVGPLDHPLQRPARPDHRRSRVGLREADGHPCERPQRRRRRPRQPDRPGGLEVAGRRDLYRELPALEFLQARGLLATVPTGTLARIPSRYDSPRGDWVGVTARVSVLVYNTTLLTPDQLPSSVMALAEPRWRDKRPWRRMKRISSPSSPRSPSPGAGPPPSPGSRGSRATPPAISIPTTKPSPTW